MSASSEPLLGGGTRVPLRSFAPSRVHVLGLLTLVTTVARVWVIHRYPEPDGDAKGHLGIATALLSHPFNVTVHWVWPPGYHYLLAALLALGFTAQGVRVLNCLLTALLPFMLWAYGERTLPANATETTRSAPFLAAVLCAVMPVVNLLGTSAEQGTVFALLVLGAVFAIDTRRFLLGGVALAAAAMVRYEAWGAVGLLVGVRALGCMRPLVRRLPPRVARVTQLPLAVITPSLLAIGAWFLAHRIAEGSWFGFLRELYRYAHVQRESIRQDLLWFPVMQPYYLFGLRLLPLFVLGVPRAWRNGFLVPLGIYVFLLASVTFKGALGSARYYESLTPFVCLAAGYGAARLGEWWRPAHALAFAAVFVQVMRLLAQLGNWTYHLGRG